MFQKGIEKTFLEGASFCGRICRVKSSATNWKSLPWEKELFFETKCEVGHFLVVRVLGVGQPYSEFSFADESWNISHRQHEAESLAFKEIFTRFIPVAGRESGALRLRRELTPPAAAGARAAQDHHRTDWLLRTRGKLWAESFSDIPWSWSS